MTISAARGKVRREPQRFVRSPKKIEFEQGVVPTDGSIEELRPHIADLLNLPQGKCRHIRPGRKVPCGKVASIRINGKITYCEQCFRRSRESVQAWRERNRDFLAIVAREGRGVLNCETIDIDLSQAEDENKGLTYVASQAISSVAAPVPSPHDRLHLERGRRADAARDGVLAGWAISDIDPAGSSDLRNQAQDRETHDARLPPPVHRRRPNHALAAGPHCEGKAQRGSGKKGPRISTAKDTASGATAPEGVRSDVRLKADLKQERTRQMNDKHQANEQSPPRPSEEAKDILMYGRPDSDKRETEAWKIARLAALMISGGRGWRDDGELEALIANARDLLREARTQA